MQYLFKNESKRKRNFIIYHFPMESKAHERIDLLITASLNIYQTKKCIPIIMKKCFSEGKLIKHFVNTPFLREPLSFHFQTPYLWTIFSWPPSLSKFWKQETALILGGGNYVYIIHIRAYSRCWGHGGIFWEAYFLTKDILFACNP